MKFQSSLVAAVAACVLGGLMFAPSAMAEEPDDRGTICPAIGCASQVKLDIGPALKRMPGARTVRACLASRCEVVRITKEIRRTGSVSIYLTNTMLKEGQRPKLRLVVRGRNGKRLSRSVIRLDMKGGHAGGFECAPYCFRADVKVRGNGKLKQVS